MKSRDTADSTPLCYAMVLPGLEEIAAREITKLLGAEIKRTNRGVVVFRASELDDSVLRLRTVEDVFLLAWGTDQLTYRAVDLESIQRWTARDVDWSQLLKIHHSIHPKPKGKPTYHLVTQMDGKHGYLRKDAGKALAKGLVGKWPASWRPAEENAAVEVWLSIQGATAVCGLRLSDRTMRHRAYKREHLPASLRPTMAAAMVQLAQARPQQIVLDPMCGAGTILAEQLAVGWFGPAGKVCVVGGDWERDALRAAAGNLRSQGQAFLARWDATRLPLADQSCDRIISNPPFGKQVGNDQNIPMLYRNALAEYDRVLKPRGLGVLLTSEVDALRRAALATGWKSQQQYRVQILGQSAAISVWRKP